jgi:hypothetical protein
MFNFRSINDRNGFDGTEGDFHERWSSLCLQSMRSKI